MKRQRTKNCRKPCKREVTRIYEKAVRERAVGMVAVACGDAGLAAVGGRRRRRSPRSAYGCFGRTTQLQADSPATAQKNKG